MRVYNTLPECYGMCFEGYYSDQFVGITTIDLGCVWEAKLAQIPVLGLQNTNFLGDGFISFGQSLHKGS